MGLGDNDDFDDYSGPPYSHSQEEVSEAIKAIESGNPNKEFAEGLLETAISKMVSENAERVRTLLKGGKLDDSSELKEYAEKCLKHEKPLDEIADVLEMRKIPLYALYDLILDEFSILPIKDRTDLKSRIKISSGILIDFDDASSMDTFVKEILQTQIGRERGYTKTFLKMPDAKKPSYQIIIKGLLFTETPTNLFKFPTPDELKQQILNMATRQQ